MNPMLGAFRPANIYVARIERWTDCRGKMFVWWRSAIEQSYSDARRIPAPVSWHWAREHIENEMSLHGAVKKNNKNSERSYLIGVLDSAKSAHELHSNVILRPGDHVVVSRKSVCARLYFKHTRNRVSPRQWHAMTEAERVTYVTETMSFDDMVYVGDAMASLRMVKAVTEDASVRCKACGRMGHSSRYCPSMLRNDSADKHGKGHFVPLWKRRPPHGIPSHYLVPATPEQYDQAYLTHGGELVIDTRSLTQPQS
jgi:hypothetical protein